MSEHKNAPVLEGDEASCVLVRAAAIVDRGWCQGRLRDGLGNVCAQGALLEASGRLDGFSPLFMEAMRRLIRGVGHHDITAWNDFPGRRREEVSAAMRKAALLRE